MVDYLITRLHRMKKLYTLEYEELETFLIKKLDAIPHGDLKIFCEKNDLSASEVSRFRNRNLPTTRPFFLQDILKAFGFKDITLTTQVIFKFKGENTSRQG